MRGANIRLIYMRELRDQLRDRRTLFTVLVLPILLYPLLGVSFIRISQFMREHPTKCWFVGYEGPETFGDKDVKSFPPLFVDDQLNPKFCPKRESDLLQITRDATLPPDLKVRVEEAIANAGPDDDLSPAVHNAIQQALAEKQVDLLLYFPPRQAESSAEDKPAGNGDDSNAEEFANKDPSIPRFYLFGNLARDESRIARTRVLTVMDRWREAIVDATLDENKLPPSATRPFLIQDRDLAASAGKQAVVWSKILPFVMLIWALTGAFYPAIDSCAGEKERGTLETLLCSPAARSEIVVGKMLNVMTFSAASSMLNLLSMMLSGLFIIQAFNQAGSALPLGTPPVMSLIWLGVAVLPASALFSSLALAVAVFARSSKEGQYYLMPLLLVSLPLMMVAMLPATELELGTSLIPLTGLMLLLRELIEGEYLAALKYFLPVMIITGAAVWLAARWAVSQFSKETVIFRESEQVGIALWLKHLIRDRGIYPGVGEAVFCGVLILIIHSFFSMMLPEPTSWASFATSTAVSLIAFVAAPPLLMALFLTLSPARTLQLRWCGFLPIIGAVALAVCLHPSLMWLGHWVVQLYPPSPEFVVLQKQLEGILDQAPGIWAIVLLIAGTPAICEEVAFRGFVLTGLSGLKNKYAAIGLSALMFGAAHGILQQSMTATVTGFALGWVAFQSRSLFPSIAYHFAHNSLSVLTSASAESSFAESGFYRWLFKVNEVEGQIEVMYQVIPTVILLIAGFVLLGAFGRLNRTHSLRIGDEESESE